MTEKHVHAFDTCEFHFDLFKSFSEDFSGFLITGLVVQGKHIFLVCFNSRLIEGIYIQDISADTAGKLKEIK